ncbi:MAG: helix-turn-helix domain-containing protein [bacterium]|nr:helix-turn-helix domain-containing protein [bacterium]
MRSLAKNLKELREKADLSQNALAERADVSPAFIYKLEAGEYNTLSIDKSRGLAKGLGMTFRDFLEAVGMLDDSATPNADLALASALRKRKFTDGQVQKVVSYVEFVEKGGKV